MARKQSDYLAALLADEQEALAPEESSPELVAIRRDRVRGSTLLSRESALARVASGEVKQVTQLLLDPARVKVWPGNARSYAHLSEASCRELIDSIVAEGGQRIPAVVRRIENEGDYEYEVIAGTRRHWCVSWLRAHSYPDLQFLAQVVQLDDEAAFRLADLENRARKDISDFERARNYAVALKDHYGNHLTRMADRLKVSKGWLSKMLKVAAIPDSVISAFSAPADVQLKPAYSLAQALADKEAAPSIKRAAQHLTKEQATRRAKQTPPLAASEVLKALLAAPANPTTAFKPVSILASRTGRPIVSVQSKNRRGITLRLHTGSGANNEEVLEAVRRLLTDLEAEEKGL
jgi:ParB family chromosome partitioning protein